MFKSRFFLLIVLFLTLVLSLNCKKSKGPTEPEDKVRFKISFTNSVFTEISITVQNLDPRTIKAGATETFEFNKNPGQITYNASTSGKSAQNGQVGLLITWNESLNVTNKTEESINLITGPAHFFLYIKNSGKSRLTPLYVNWGTVEQTQDNIVIPNDNVTYNLGYYKAFANTEIRMHLEPNPSSYVYWKNGTHFNFTYTNNQTITLQNTNFRSLNKAPGNPSPFVNQEPALLLPKHSQNMNLTPENCLNHVGRSSE